MRSPIRVTVRPIRPTQHPARALAYVRDGWWRDDTLWDALVATAARQPDRVALVEGDIRLAFRDLARRADALASGLAALGIAPGDAVAFQLPNWWETVVVLLAIARLGAVGVPILPINRQREVAFILRQTRARALFIPGRYRDCDHRELAATIRPELPALAEVIVVRDDAAPGMRALATLATSSAPSPAPAAEPDDVALVIYTSGTTADPKGVLHSHRTLLAEARSLAPVHDLSARDTVLMPSPLTHISGIVHALLVPAALGSCAVLMPRWEPGEALRLIAAERVTYMVGAPTFLRELAQHPRLRLGRRQQLPPLLVRRRRRRPDAGAPRPRRASAVSRSGSTARPSSRPSPRRVLTIHPRGASTARDGRSAPRRSGWSPTTTRRCRRTVRARCWRADRSASSATSTARSTSTPSRPTAGSAPATSRRSTTRATCGSPDGRRTSSSARARTSARASWRTCSPRTRQSPRSPSSGVPDAAAGEIACAVVRLRTGHAALSLADVTGHLLAHGLSKRKLPERLVIADDFPRTASGKVLKRALREQLAGGG